MRNIRHKTNPFLNNLIIQKGAKTIKVNSTFGQENNVVINQDTGELKGTYIGTYRQVDETKFVKLFTQNIALTFDLTAAGIKAFNVLMYAVQNQAINRDSVFLDESTLDDFFKIYKLKNLSLKTLYRGINELIKSQILAKSNRVGVYFINPSFVFNGDRLVFSNIIEREKSDIKSTGNEHYKLEQEKE